MVALGAGLLIVATGGAGLIAAAPAAGSAAAGTTGAVTGAGAAAATATAGGGVSATATGGVAFSYASSTSAAAGSVALGPLGFIAVGANSDSQGDITWNCWKAVLHNDDSNESSEGMLLRTIAEDSRIKAVNIEEGKKGMFPKITLINIWDEAFQLAPVVLPDGQIAFHAEKILTIME